MSAPPIRSPDPLLEALRAQIVRLEATRRPADGTIVSSGCAAIDGLLPEGGFRRGTLVEWLAAGEGSGAQTLAMIAARQACREGGSLVVVDAAQEFYPPAAAGLGIDLERLVVVQAAKDAEWLWALDQALRCGGVAAALAWAPRLDGRTFRRLQLAAEEGGGLGLLVRPVRVRGQPSWANVRLLVESRPGTDGTGRRLRIEMLLSRGGKSGRVEVEIDDSTNDVHLVPQLADPTVGRRAAGAY
jgi:protein ImuA